MNRKTDEIIPHPGQHRFGVTVVKWRELLLFSQVLFDKGTGGKDRDGLGYEAQIGG